MADKKAFVHVLIAATYSTSIPIPSKILGDVLADRLMRTTDLHTVTAYSMAYPIRPTDCGLKDVWDRMSDEYKEVFADQFPDLATAIALMCGGNDGEEQVRNQKDGNRIKPTQS
jgi:hypothetical protein